LAAELLSRARNGLKHLLHFAFFLARFVAIYPLNHPRFDWSSRANRLVILLRSRTSDSRGSLAFLRDEQFLQVAAHDSREDRSPWAASKLGRRRACNQLKMQDVGG
jgi:hypothetical protein